jgi:hypothetical protein
MSIQTFTENYQLVQNVLREEKYKKTAMAQALN